MRDRSWTCHDMCTWHDCEAGTGDPSVRADTIYRVLASTEGFEAEWKTTKDSAYLDSPLLYKENGFKKEESAKQLITELSADAPIELIVQKVEKKTEKKAPPMLYNLAELQNDCYGCLRLVRPIR